ncbi:MAG TPA: hypothetical protein VFO10_10620 [Oligoflexus sp.]|uniref:hypothetical protein n=1 Tax=Oligoflexus sp. TaxID=1971216 RepID=UPI002D7EC410|nr:hypothetical protein [Oligoflexus sp.]HET9237697.1 hypothetical protein [Oligoflexus sp.]
MRITLKQTFLASSLLCGLLTGACKKDDSTTSDSKETATGTLRISLVAAGDVAGAGAGLRSRLVDPVNFSNYTNGHIAAGTPDSMKVLITKMTLSKADNSKNLPIFSDPEGKAIDIKGSSVDVSSFFTRIECIKQDGTVIDPPEGQTCKCGVNGNGELIQQEEVTAEDGTKSMACPPLKEGETPPFGVMEVDQEGDFDQLTVEYLNKGEARGCVSGKFSYGATTFCTKSGQDLDAAGSFTKADYPSTGATAATIYWSKEGKSTNASFSKTYPIGSTISITADGESPKLTMVIDQGRMLRFFDGETSQGPNPMPGLPGNKAYFFSTVFEDSTFVFVGQPGGIRGYRYGLRAIKDKSMTDAVPAQGSLTCTPTVDDCNYVNGWLTVIEDPSGKPLAISVMPDDDNAWTIMKGGNYDSANPGAIKSSDLTVNADGTWTLTYNLLDPDGSGLVGTIYKLDPTAAVDSTQTLEFSAKNASSAGQFNTWGAITLQRGL